MRATVLEYKNDFEINLTPETAQETAVLMRYVMKGKAVQTTFDINFNANLGTNFTVRTPIAKSRNGFSLIQNKDLKII